MMRFIIIILFLTMAIVLFLTQTQPHFDEIKILKESKRPLEEALQYSRELQVLRDDLLSQYNAIPREDIERLDKILPAEIDSGKLIVMLEDRVKNNGLLLKKIDVQEEKLSQDLSVPIGAPLPSFRTIGLSLSISGSYVSFLALLADLEKSLRIVDIDQIDFSGGAKETIEFKISARTYAALSANALSVIREEKGMQAREILLMLSKLKGIKISTDFFQSEVFKSLIEFAPALIVPEKYGRPNPFIPIEETTVKK